MTVGRLRRLAEALGMRMTELLVEARPELAPERAHDAQRLGTALMQQARAASSTALASGLRLTLDELHAAADHLDALLAGTGIRLLRNRWRFAGEPRVLTKHESTRLLARARTVDGLTIHAAKIVYQVITEQIAQTSSLGLGSQDRSWLHHVINHGIVQLDARGGFCLHPGVAYSLGVDHLAGRAGPRVFIRQAGEALGHEHDPLDRHATSRAGKSGGAPAPAPRHRADGETTAGRDIGITDAPGVPPVERPPAAPQS